MELHITSRRPSWSSSLRELYAYRDLLWILAYREVSVRYKQTALGVLWVVLQPLLATGVFTVIFGKMANLPSDGIPHVVFFFCGMTIWGLFFNAVSRAGLSVVADEKLITKVYFPRAVIPLSSIVSSGFDFLVTLGVLLIMAGCYGFLPGLRIVEIVPAVIIASLASAGLGTALAGWTVRYRDFRYLVPFFLQLGIYASPIVYPTSWVVAKYHDWSLLYYLNPMAGATDLFRFAITGLPALNSTGILISAVVSILLFVIGGSVFRRVEQSFADLI